MLWRVLGQKRTKCREVDETAEGDLHLATADNDCEHEDLGSVSQCLECCERAAIDTKV